MLQRFNTIIKTFPVSDANYIDLRSLWKWLKDEAHVNFLVSCTRILITIQEVSSGPKTLATLLHQKLLQEARITITGQYVGHLNTFGLHRPTFGYAVSSAFLLQLRHVG
jgi:hypothetical protein